MTTTIKTYDPKKWLNNFAGIPFSAYAPGSFMTVEFDEEAFKKKIGATGEVVRIMNANKGAKVTITLMQHSADNDALSAIHMQDRIDGSGVGVFSGLELNGSSFVRGEAWIQKSPNLERGAEDSSVVWVFDIAEATVFIGGLQR